NPVLIMVASGARGTTTNLRHLAGMRGRLDTEYPICANLREGLHPYEFFMSAKMSRRTLVDKKLGVAYFGDYTRRMVHAGFDLQISEADCGTTAGIDFPFSDPDQSAIVVPHLVGRFRATDGAYISENVIREKPKPSIQVRSPL